MYYTENKILHMSMSNGMIIFLLKALSMVLEVSDNFPSKVLEFNNDKNVGTVWRNSVV